MHSEYGRNSKKKKGFKKIKTEGNSRVNVFKNHLN